MSRPHGYIGFEFGDDETFTQQIIDREKIATEESRVLEQQKKMLECHETMSHDEEPVPTKSLDFEEAFRSAHLQGGYESPYKNIAFLKEDIATVNSMSQCAADDIAKLIRNIQNSVYTLGLDEARQCRRGKLLEVLKSTNEASPRFQQSSSSPIASGSKTDA